MNESAQNEENKIIMKYQINIQGIISLMRNPLYLKHIETIYGVDGSSIIEFFMINSIGNMTECLDSIEE